MSGAPVAPKLTQSIAIGNFSDAFMALTGQSAASSDGFSMQSFHKERFGAVSKGSTTPCGSGKLSACNADASIIGGCDLWMLNQFVVAVRLRFAATAPILELLRW